MIHLDIVNVFGAESGITCAGGARIFDSKPVVKKYMRVRDDRFPGEEMLIPVEDLERVEELEQDQNNVPFALMPGEALMEPF